MKKRSFVLYAMNIFLLLSICTHGAFAQGQKITGTVTDSFGEFVPGVNVVEVGTQNGTITDVNGEFSLLLENPAAESVLRFSFIGFATKEVPVEGRTLIDVTLEEDIMGLDEVVVVGYGSVKKSDLTGSVATVEVESIKDIPANSVESLLQGRTAGLQVINSSQAPGAGATVRIRGGSSLRGSNAPLVVVDGFPLGDAGDLKQINPEDIASIEVLKDASASAIYGSRGANGVIMITTGKAKEGVTEVNVSQKTSISQFTSKLNKWNDPLLMAKLTNEEMVNAGRPIIYDGEVNSVGVYYPSIHEIESGDWPYNTQWDEIVFRDLPISNNSTVSIKSANEKTSFNLSLNYVEEKGVYIEDDYQKGIVNLGVSHQIFDNLKIVTSNIFSKNFRNDNGGLAYWRNPLWPVRDENGEYYQTTVTDFGHPLAITDFVKNENNGLDYITSYLLDYQIIESLNLKSQVNYKYGNSITDQYFPEKYTEAGYFNNGAAYLNKWMGQDFLTETYVTFEKTFGKVHALKAMAGHSFQYSMQRSTNMGSYNFVNEALQNENMGAGDPEKNTHSNSYSDSRLLSYIGRLNYSLMDKYMATFTFRADGSSKFGENNKWANFPSGALSWKAHNEPFVQSLGVFDQFKVRVSYGISGNQGISPYQTLSRYGIENYYDAGAWRTAIGPGYVVGYSGADDRYRIWGGIPNLDLKWETTEQFNLGLDLAFLNRRLRFTVDMYNKHTTDLLRERILSLSSGYDRMWVNDGSIDNKGFEVTMEADIIHNANWNLASTFVFSQNENEVVSLGEAVSSGLQTDNRTGMKYEFTGYSFTQFRQNANILAVGQPRNVFYGYKTDGIIQSEAEGLEAGLTGEMAQSGEFKYVDLNHDGVIDVDDRTIIGDPNPDFTASLAVDVGYKNFDLSVFLNGVYGNDILYQNRMDEPNVRPLRWTLDNQTNDYPSLRNGRQYLLSDWFIQDGSFLRIQNVNFGYNFNTNPASFFKKVKLYLNVSNLYTFTNFDGYDPEVGMDGIYWGGYPRLRNWTLGLNVTF
ncbi:SusC/RagA family TonB-linked outer membrane protein [Anaerophaga thermohalophila]|uniref:SusC/RagA family TonB-linked outer membrane protein n=1 Tax=Anaerophaga thermohalophila TaxID=177400 RepID=UPI000237B90C|nr:TonB-dependent receptor [Anaerophaga thermohalophila]